MKKKWIKLGLSKYQGYFYYYPIETKSDGKFQHYFDVKIHLPENKIINIRWPTGSVSKEKIVYSKYYDIKTDRWGGKYEVSGSYAGIEFFHRGFNFWSDLDGLEVDLNEVDNI